MQHWKRLSTQWASYICVWLKQKLWMFHSLFHIPLGLSWTSTKMVLFWLWTWNMAHWQSWGTDVQGHYSTQGGVTDTKNTIFKYIPYRTHSHITLATLCIAIASVLGIMLIPSLTPHWLFATWLTVHHIVEVSWFSCRRIDFMDTPISSTDQLSYLSLII